MSDVSLKSADIAAMHANNALIDALLGGTKAMRKAGKTYLQQFELENEDKYKSRLARATLYPAFSETISQMVGRVFFESISTENVHSALRDYLPNIDLQGNNVDVFMMSVFKSALCYGVSYVLVDYPVVEHAKTLAEEKAQGARPYFVPISPQQLLGIKSEIVNGKRQLTQFRYQEQLTVDDGEFAQKTIQQIVVLEIGRVRKYRQSESGWQLVSDMALKAGNKPLSQIPIVPIYTKPSQFMLGEPPLLELANLNIKHWQSQSDQDNILNVARVPLLCISGVTSAEEFQIGASAVQLPLDASMVYVEHSGAAISAGQESLKELEEQMKVAGAKLLTKTALAMTDSQAKDEQGKEISQLRAMANRLEDGLDQALDLMLMWLNISGENQVEISGNIDDDLDPTASMEAVMKLQASGVLSRQSAFEEAKRRGLISDSLTWEEEQTRLDTDGLGTLFDSARNAKGLANEDNRHQEKDSRSDNRRGTD